MPPRRQKKNAGTSSKENDQSLMNSENLTIQMNSGPLKPTNENSSQRHGPEFEDLKPNRASRTSSITSHGKKSIDKKDAAGSQKDLAKPIIKEKPAPTPPKDWDEAGQSIELNLPENQDIASNDEKSQGYEEHFPTLGNNDLETSRPETAFSTEILSPTNIFRTQVKEMTDTSSIMMNEEDKMHQRDFMEDGLPPMSDSKGLESSNQEEKPSNEWEKNAPELTTQAAPVEDETPVEEEKVEQYENHFPALGEEPEVANVETEFTPEILEPKVIAEEVVDVQPENPIPYLTHDDKKPQDTTEPVEKTPSDGHITSEWEKNAPELTQNIIPVDDLTPAPAEKVEAYETHFPALGEEPEVTKPVVEFTPEILEPKVVAEEAVEVTSANPGSVLSNEEAIPETVTPNNSREDSEEGSDEAKPEHSDYVSIEQQVDVSTKLETIAHPTSSKVEIQNETEGESAPVLDAYLQGSPDKETLSNTEVQDEPVTVTALENKGRESPDTFGGQLASEIEQVIQAEEMEAQEKQEEVYEGKEQREKQDEQLKEEEAMAAQFKPLIEEVLRISEQEHKQEGANIDPTMQESWGVISHVKQASAFEDGQVDQDKGFEPVKADLGDQEELEQLLQQPGDVDYQPDVEPAYGKIKVEEEKPIKYAERLDTPKETTTLAQPDLQPVEEKIEGSDMESIEENIVTGDEQGEGVDLQEVLKPDLQKVEARSLADLPLDDAKPYNKTSLEYLAEDQTAIVQSTEATLSSQRIDLIREEVKEFIEEPIKNDALFREVQKNLDIVRGLEKSKMYGAAINILKKNIEILDTRIIRNEDFSVDEMNRLLVESNTECAYCFNLVNEHKSAIDYARAALNLSPQNIKAIYLLGSNLLKAGDQLGGYNVLKGARSMLVSENEPFYKLIEIELQKCEKRAIDVQKEIEPILKKPGTVSSKEKHVKINVPEQKKAREEPAKEVLTNLGVFSGAAGLSGLASWIVTKNYLNLPERRSIAYSVGIGALVGGLSLFFLSHSRKGTKSNK